MKSSKHGTTILNNSVTGIGNTGLWVICEDKEYFIPFNDYPALKNASIDNIFNLITVSPKQLYWPDIDIDIEIDALETPDRFPLIYK
jgi:hypothetical protein